MQNISSKLLTSADGTKIYADAVGDPANPGIVFVHGFSASSAVFNDIFSNPKYSEDYYLVRYDTRGHGKTGKPAFAESYSSQKYAEDFVAVLKAFDVKKPVFVGWSMGGTILADIAAHLPSTTLKGAVNLSSSPCTGPIIESASTAAVGPLFSGLLTPVDAAAAYEAMLAANLLTFVKDGNPGAGFLEKCIKTNEDGGKIGDSFDVAVPWETRCAFLGMAAHMSPTHRLLAAAHKQDTTKLFELGKHGFPLLVVYGTHDGYFSGDKLYANLQPIFAHLSLKRIEGGSHAVFLESPEEVMSAIFEFASKVSV